MSQRHLSPVVSFGLIALTALATLTTLTGCGDDGATPPADSGAVDAQIKDAGGDLFVADLAPDGPKQPARWETVSNAPQLEGHTVTLLGDGRALIVGGHRGFKPETTLKEAYLYFPDQKTISQAGALSVARTRHTATLMSDGRVLVIGGHDDTSTHKTTEIFDPKKPLASAWSKGPDLLIGRSSHAAVAFSGGAKVLVIAGHGEVVGTHLKSLAILDVASGSFSFPSGGLKHGRSWPSVTVLPTGKVLIAAGYDNSQWHLTMELYDPTTGAVTESKATLKEGRTWHGMGRLADGRLLFVGGRYLDSKGIARTADDEMYDPLTDTVTPISHPGQPVQRLASATLADGRVLVTGGYLPSQQSEVVLYSPAAGGSWSKGPGLKEGRYGHTATLLKDGSVLVVGGKTGSSGPYRDSAERFYP